MKISMYTHTSNSQGGTALAAVLGIKRIKHKNSKFRGRSAKVVINWGASKLPEQVALCSVINWVESVKIAVDKVRCFEYLVTAKVSVPPVFTSKQQAVDWMRDKGGRVIVCRTLTRSSAGKGIVIAEDIDQVVTAPLYTGYIKKQSEFRIHVLGGEVIDRQRKARNKEVDDDDVNWRIRTHTNGFIYMREDVEYPEGIDEQAIRAVEACGLDFGAVDIVYNKLENRCYVLEVNSAPGLEGHSLDIYAKAFNNFLLDN